MATEFDALGLTLNERAIIDVVRDRLNAEVSKVSVAFNEVFGINVPVLTFDDRQIVHIALIALMGIMTGRDPSEIMSVGMASSKLDVEECEMILKDCGFIK